MNTTIIPKKGEDCSSIAIALFDEIEKLGN